LKDKKKLNILILNWRDIKNPQSGGAEILTQEISQRLVKLGHTVTIFSSYFKGARKTEKIKGVKIMRDGDPDLRSLFSSVHFKAYTYYKKQKFGVIDLVIDEIHGVPFFTPLYIKERKAVLICELAGDLWDLAFSFPFNYVGKLFERTYPILYKKNTILTISESSKKEISPLFTKKNIQVIRPGCITPIIRKYKNKVKNRNMIFIARLSNAKGVEDAVKSVEILKKEFPTVQLNILGRGEKRYLGRLKSMVKKLRLETNIHFQGYVSESEKMRLIDKSAVLLTPSSQEGWGLTVHEANSRGVPAVSYNVKGLKEVVKDNVNGFLCKKNTPEELARLSKKIFLDKKLQEKLFKQSVLERRSYTWERTTQEFLDAVAKNL